MAPIVKRLVPVIGITAAIVALVVITAGFGGFFDKPLRYEIPASFRGWVTVIYENPSCKALDRDGLYLVVRIDETGKGCSSSPMPQGWRYTKYVRVGKDGQRTTLVHSSWANEQSRMIWAPAVMVPQGGYQHVGEVFFVGTAEQLKAAWSSQPIPNLK